MLQTKEEFTKVLTSLLTPLKSHYTRECAGLKIGDTSARYETDTNLFEGFSRILWGLVPIWKERSDAFLEFQVIYQKGFAAGTNPENPEYWGQCHDYDQRFVEMAAIAYGLLLVPNILWDPLEQQAKENLASWLNQINEHKLPLCNWEFFRVLVNLALKKHGMKFSEERLAFSLQCVEDFYVGDGWYQDGDSKQTDYYIPWAMHFYGLVYSVVMEKEDPERCKRYRERAELFAKDFIYWFAENGAALPYGRSLTYRFAQCSFFSACILADIRPFSLGVMKGIIARNFEYWADQVMVDQAGLLTIGYCYPNLHMAESYNSPGSPYWAFKSFALLALPDNHEFWQMKQEPLPQLKSKRLMPQAEMVLTRQKGEVIAYTPGNYTNTHAHAPSKYGKFAYSTRFGFSVPKTSINLGEAAPDSTLAFELDGYYLPKRQNISSEVTDSEIRCCWQPCHGITVETTILPDVNGHVRKHKITSEIECTAYDCAFAVSNVRDNVKTEVVNDTGNENTAKASSPTESCSITSTSGKAVVIGASPNTNLVASKTVIPAIQYQIKKGITEVTSKITIEQ